MTRDVRCCLLPFAKRSLAHLTLGSGPTCGLSSTLLWLICHTLDYISWDKTLAYEILLLHLR